MTNRDRVPAAGPGAHSALSDAPSDNPEPSVPPESLAVECARLRAELQAMYDARAELERVNQQLSLILEQQPVIPYTCKAEGDFGATYMGPSILRVAGYRPEQLIEQPSFWADHIHPDDAARVFEGLGVVFEHDHHEHEYRWQIADGSYRWFFDCLRLIRDTRGAPLYIVGAWLDITERKVISRVVRQQRQFLRILLDAIPDLVSAHDAEGRMTLVNRAFCEHAQISHESANHHFIHEVVAGAPGMALSEKIDEVLGTQQPSAIQIQLTSPDGGERTIETIVVPHCEPGGDLGGAIAIGRDVTEREESAAALKRAKEQAEFANRSKSDFLARMSHEIRTPLNSILGYSQLLDKRIAAEQFPAYVTEYLEHINVSGHNLWEIVNNILELSKIEEGKVSVATEPLDLALLVRRVFNLSKLRATEKGIDFTYRYDRTLPRAVRTDRTKVTQILSNLLSNAIKFTPRGKRVSLVVERQDDKILFSVSDQGIGIAKDKQAAVFNPFEQANSSIAGSYGGTGLGLAICRQLSELLGGRIWLESAFGKGAKFFVELPLQEGLDSLQENHVSPPRPDFARDSKILVVEDNPMNRAVLRALFADLQLDIVLAEDGRDGVRKAMELAPDCIFMDLHLPHLDGLQATRQLRELPQFAQTPIIALSADAFSEQQESAFAAGVTDYLTKPIRLEDLVEKLGKYVPAERVRPPAPEHALDTDGLREYSAALFEQLRDMFMEMVPVALAEIRRFAQTGAYQELADRAHTLKNYGMGMFATRFTALSIELELEGKRGGHKRVHELIAELERAYQDAVVALAEWAELHRT